MDTGGKIIYHTGLTDEEVKDYIKRYEKMLFGYRQEYLTVKTITLNNEIISNNTKIHFVVMQFVCASTVKVNLLDISIEEIHGLGSYRTTTYYSSEEALVESLSYKVRHHSRLGEIQYESQT